MNLREYQTQAVDDFNQAIAEGIKRPIIVAPTASGKTVIAAAIIKQSIGKDVLVLAHRRELREQF